MQQKAIKSESGHEVSRRVTESLYRTYVFGAARRIATASAILAALFAATITQVYQSNASPGAQSLSLAIFAAILAAAAAFHLTYTLAMLHLTHRFTEWTREHYERTYYHPSRPERLIPTNHGTIIEVPRADRYATAGEEKVLFTGPQLDKLWSWYSRDGVTDIRRDSNIHPGFDQLGFDTRTYTKARAILLQGGYIDQNNKWTPRGLRLIQPPTQYGTLNSPPRHTNLPEPKGQN